MKKNRIPDSDIDRYRRLLLKLLAGPPATTMKTLSEEIGRGESFVQQYLRYAEPKWLESYDCDLIAKHFAGQVKPSDLRPPPEEARRLKAAEPTLAYGEKPQSHAEEPAAPYEARDAVGDLAEGLERLSIEERIESNAREVASAAYELLIEMGNSITREGVQRALAARKRHVHENRADILRGRAAPAR